MIGRLMVPVAGTIAALIAIALAREPRRQDVEPPPSQFPADVPEHGEPFPEDEMAPEEEAPPTPPPPPAPEPQEFQLELGADGTLVDIKNGRTFASPEKLEAELDAARHKIVITNGQGVAEAALDAAFTKLRDAKDPGGDPRFQVRKVYRAPEAPAGEER